MTTPPTQHLHLMVESSVVELLANDHFPPDGVNSGCNNKSPEAVVSHLVTSRAYQSGSRKTANRKQTMCC